MDVVISILAVLAGIIGIIGSIVPALPGPPISWIGLLLMYLWGGTNGNGEPMSTSTLLIWLGVTTLVTLLDYIVPAWFTKLTGGSRYAGWGAAIGLVIGIFLPPVGIVLGTLAGAFIAELVFADKDVWSSAKSALGAFAGFILGTGAKLLCCGLMLWQIIVYM
ncbi:MAG: DUF456 domain-containing protein [Candidatus Cryptobacteroides sp.]|nr:DUF456 domain-containing protein [Bacteroidales bacterium]